MLKKEFRGLTRKEVLEIKEKGVMVKTPLFGWVGVKTDKSKIGFVVSKRISKLAVERNKVRRRLAEVVKRNWEDYAKKGVKGLILVRGMIVEKGIEEIEREWKGVLKRI